MSPLYNQIEGYEDIINAAEPNRGGLGAFNAAFGNSVEKFLGTREPDDISKKIEANAIDRLFGHSTEELTEAYFKKKYKGLKSNKKLTDYLGSNKNNKINITDTDLQILSKANAYQDLKDFKKNVIETTNYVIPSNINTIEAAAQNLQQQRSNDLLSPRNILRDDRRIAEEGRNFERERLGLERELKLLDSNSQRELQRGNLALQNRELDRRDRSDTRNREMQLMYALMGGINNLGKVLNA